MFLYYIHALMQKFHILISGGSRPWAKRNFLSLALLAFLPFVIFFLPKIWGGGEALGPPSPSPRSTTVNHSDILINHSTTRASPLFSTRGGLYQPLIGLEKEQTLVSLARLKLFQTTTSVYKFSILFLLHVLRYLQGEFV